MRSLLLATLVLAAPALAQPAAEPVDTSAVSFFRSEPSQVMDHALWLTDVHGARLTASRQLDQAQVWARDRFASWGLSATLEPWGTFGRGWHIQRFSMIGRVGGPDVTEQAFPIYAAPKAWSPSTGTLTAEVVVLDPTDDAAFDRVAGTLRGKVVLLGGITDIDRGLEAIGSRRDAVGLLEMANSAHPHSPAGGRTYSPEALARFRAAQTRRNRLFAEQPLAILEPSNLGGHGAIRVMAAQMPVPDGAPMGTRPMPWAEGATTIPQFVLMDEHANRIVRLVQAGQRVMVDLDFAAEFTAPVEEDNVIAEIRGTDLAGEVVILGAHVDSWHAGSGATDNAAGSSVVMEAARLLSRYYETSGTRPRRTIRFALWTGEEQGLYGSIGYVNRHYATLPGFGQPPTAILPDQSRVSAYYNLDNGSGRIRGVYLQGNTGVAPIFRAWLDAFADSTAQTLTPQNTSGTDHLAFDAAGIPGFQFIQDPLAYGRHTWHTTMDTYDHLDPDDLEQASRVMATFAHHTAMRDAMLPRKPQPEVAGGAAGGARTGAR